MYIFKKNYIFGEIQMPDILYRSWSNVWYSVFKVAGYQAYSFSKLSRNYVFFIYMYGTVALEAGEFVPRLSACQPCALQST